MKRLLKVLTMGQLLLFLTVSMAWAQPNVGMTMTAQKEVIVERNGKEVTELVTAESILPGEVVHYDILVKNSGDENAIEVIIDNPVPTDTTYVEDSAYGIGANILFSMDGELFQVPTQLTYSVVLADGSKKERKANPDEYRFIRWVIKDIVPSGIEKIGFKVQVNK